MKKALVVKIVLLVAVIALLWWQREAIFRVLALLLLSATMAYLMSPLAGLLERRLSSKWGAALAFFGAFLALAGLLWALVPQLARQAVATGEALPELWGRATAFVEGLQEALRRRGLSEELLASVSWQWNRAGEGILSALGDWAIDLGKTAMTLGWVLLSPVAAFYLLRDRARLLSLAERWLPSSARPLVVDIAHAARELLAQYVRGQVLVSLITGTVTAIGLWVAGLPSWLLMGALMAFFNIIPYFGPFLGALPIALFAMLGGWGLVFRCMAAVLIAQQIEALFVAPRILSGAANLHPLAVTMALFVGGAAFGIAGLLFAIPTVLLLRVVAERVMEDRVRRKTRGI